MADRRLPLRVCKESLYSGRFKRTNHRALPEFQRFEIEHNFPRFPQIFGEWIVRRISRSDGQYTGHPCLKAFDFFLDCTRRHPDTYTSKCRMEAGRCLTCFEEHKEFQTPDIVHYMRYLEHFRVFSEGTQSLDAGPGKFRYKPITPMYHGTGTVMTFGGYGRGGGGGGRR
mmetsp:Transcript_59188/g.165292  ORF Transcript_59188/g.165292 Transcript_59188/m.165292 type:complete len:170 (+) Transcript_59188:90-599(+)